MKRKEGGAQSRGSVGRVAQDLTPDSGFLLLKLCLGQGDQPPRPGGSSRPRVALTHWLHE